MIGLTPASFANVIAAMNRRPMLGKIDPNAHNRHDRLRNE
jgi:hypothetical protein